MLVGNRCNQNQRLNHDHSLAYERKTWFTVAMTYLQMVAVVLLLTPFSVLAKDAAKPPNSARVSKGSPTIEGGATKKAGDAQQAPLPLPLPVRIVEEPPESDNAKYRADRARDNEDQDLKAQQSMASSAKSQLEATYFVIGVSIIGTIFLVWTIFETRRAALAAWRSVDIAQQGVTIARETAEKQLRAYVNISRAYISFQGTVPTVHLAMTNFGHTNARQTALGYDFAVGGPDWQVATTLEQTTSASTFQYGVMGPTSVITIEAEIPPLLPDAVSEMKVGKKGFYFWGEIRYNDAFDQPQTTKFRTLVLGRQWFTDTRLGICPQGNDAT